ncbi:MAG: RNA polymerase sigma factor (sigma-70 family) [Verrucomicrobiales bacterium]|jgi:RNA polymerase sigma factor (sigma-70 family)
MTLTDEDFYRKHADGLIRMATALVGPNNAEDVFSSAVLRVLNSRTWRRLDDDERRAYLCRSIMNEAKRWGRQAGRRQQRESIYSAQRLLSESMTEPEEIWAAVASLSVRQRAVVFLTYYEDLDTAAVAKSLGISPGSVYQHLNRARNALKEATHG